MTQLKIFPQPAPWENRRSEGEPKLWIKEFFVFQKVSSEELDIVRRVTFRPGVNVVWTPNGTGSAMTGHTAGKSLLVNFIRSLLSGPGQIPEFTALRFAHPQGGIAAVIGLNGIEWHAVKPFRHGERGGATNRGGFEYAFAEGWHAFTREISDLTSGVDVETHSIVPWLTRDQRSRLANIWTWQPGDTKPNNHRLISKVLKIRHPDSERLESEMDEISHRRTSLKAARDRSLQRVHFFREELDIENQAEPADSVDFDFHARITELRTAAAKVEEERESLANDRLLPQEQELALTLESLEQHRVGRDEISSQIEDLEAKIRQGDLSVISPYQSRLEPNRHICSIPLITARSHCPLNSAEMPTHLGHELLERKRFSTVEEARGSIEQLTRSMADFENAIAELQSEAVSQRRGVLAERNRMNFKRDRLSDDLARLTARIRRLERLKEEEERYRRLSQEVEDIGADLKRVRAAIDALQADRRVVLRKFADVFDAVVKFVVSKESTGTAHGENGVLDVEIVQDVVRSSAAIDSLKVPLFDIAALIHSLMGNGSLPPFLVHDSIREADLAEDIYHRIFDLMCVLEAQAADFQYIILTTTPPPIEMQHEPFLRARLAAFPAEERLCKVNF